MTKVIRKLRKSTKQFFYNFPNSDTKTALLIPQINITITLTTFSSVSNDSFLFLFQTEMFEFLISIDKNPESKWLD